MRGLTLNFDIAVGLDNARVGSYTISIEVSAIQSIGWHSYCLGAVVLTWRYVSVVRDAISKLVTYLECENRVTGVCQLENFGDFTVEWSLEAQLCRMKFDRHVYWLWKCVRMGIKGLVQMGC